MDNAVILQLLPLFGVVSRLRCAKIKAPALIVYFNKQGRALLLTWRSLETTPNITRYAQQSLLFSFQNGKSDQFVCSSG